MSSRIARLLQNYQRHAELPWPPALAGAQKVWFAVYDPADDRRVRARVGEFELATKRAGHGWQLGDVTNLFAEWMAAHEYRESYFASPELLGVALDDFKAHAVRSVRALLEQADEHAVVALLGVGALFGVAKASDVINGVHSAIRGRLLVFFPGEYENNTYRLLDARDGWNYMAVPITSHEGRLAP